MEGNLYWMTELPMIESLCLRKDFWDRHGANIYPSPGRKIWQKVVSTSKKKRILERENRFFAAVLAL